LRREKTAIAYAYVLKKFKVLLLIGMKMNLKLLFVITSMIGIILLTNFVQLVQAPKPLRGFVISLPSLVEASPGETLTINGSILNIGIYWLRDFNISISGLPEDFEVKVIPEKFEVVKILREWNPEKGVYRVPEKFWIEIKVPENASGVYLVSVKGKEWWSWKKVENSTQFALKISAPPKLSISEIVVPEKVVEFEEFNISFEVKNEGLTNQTVSVKVIAPEDWEVRPGVQDLMVEAGTSKLVVFTLKPTNTSGNISIFMEYPFKAQILNLTKAGPFIVPAMAEEEVPPLEIQVPTALVALAEFVRKNTLVAIIAAILLIIIFWNVWGIIKQLRVKKSRRRAEEFVEVDAKTKPI